VIKLSIDQIAETNKRTFITFSKCLIFHPFFSIVRKTINAKKYGGIAEYILDPIDSSDGLNPPATRAYEMNV
tara:strand:+ start:289 stop:504 length:216 start_codon:yes stop_codon:yes gene_type:complete